MPTDEKDDFDKGFLFKHSALDMANQGFATLDFHNTSTARTSQRAELSNYLMFPTKFKFPKVVRILAICTKFVSAFVRKWRKTTASGEEPPTFFNCFLSEQRNLMSTPLTAYTEFHAKLLAIQYPAHTTRSSRWSATRLKALTNSVLELLAAFYQPSRWTRCTYSGPCSTILQSHGRSGQVL